MVKTINKFGLRFLLVVIPAAHLNFDLYAAEDTLWQRELELGAVASSGNTEESNVKLLLNVVRNNETTKFMQFFHLDLLNSKKDQQVTAQKLYAAYELNYKLKNTHQLFSRFSYEDDRFSGFDYQANFTFGYKRSLIKADTWDLNAALGSGFRSSKLETGGLEEEFIVRFAQDYHWKISENAEFSQALSAEAGAGSTISRLGLVLSSIISSKLTMKLGLNVKHQSAVPVGLEKMDTDTSVTIVYKF